MKKRLKFLFPTLMMVCVVLLSCSESEDTVAEYVDWQARNAAYFSARMAEANAAISAAKATYGDAWEEHCDWRAYLSYSLEPGEGRTMTDSICAEVIIANDGSDTEPVYSTDSVRVFFRGQLIPSTSYPDGRVFSYSGQSPHYDRVFDRETAPTAKFYVTSLVRGIGTALLHMRNGDRWRIYVPHTLAYGEDGYDEVPGYSVLIFEMELLGHYRAGTTTGTWN